MRIATKIALTLTDGMTIYRAAVVKCFKCFKCQIRELPSQELAQPKTLNRGNSSSGFDQSLNSKVYSLETFSIRMRTRSLPILGLIGGKFAFDPCPSFVFKWQRCEKLGHHGYGPLRSVKGIYPRP